MKDDSDLGRTKHDPVTILCTSDERVAHGEQAGTQPGILAQTGLSGHRQPEKDGGDCLLHSCATAVAALSWDTGSWGPVLQFKNVLYCLLLCAEISIM